MRDTHDVIVIGAGAAGLTAAGGCAMFGLQVALVERAAIGGECLNTGCVPSKALLAAAARAQQVRDAGRFGIEAGEPRVDFAGVRAHVQGAIAAIAPRDGRERFEALGVEVIAGEARFTGDRQIEVAGRRLAAPRVVIAAGSRTLVPEALAGLPVLTNETAWDLEALPERLAIIGGGPVGMEMAQAFRRLGSSVVLATSGRCLPRDDAQAAALVVEALRREGVVIHEQAALQRAEQAGGDVRLHLAGGTSFAATHVLAAAGREVVLDALNLAATGLLADRNGIAVDAKRRTGVRGIHAIGDCRAGPRFTHAAGRDGAAVALGIALGWNAPVDDDQLPAATYTDPELAQLGLTEDMARERFAHVSAITEPFAHDDRAVAEGDTAGFVKIVRAQGRWGRRLVGVTIVGAHAGELLLPWSLLLTGKTSLFGLASQVVAYPTRSERSKEVAFRAMEPLVFSGPAKAWARFLAKRRRRS